MNTLILGATGATGRHVAKFLLEWGHHVRMIVRSKELMPTRLRILLKYSPLLDP